MARRRPMVRATGSRRAERNTEAEPQVEQPPEEKSTSKKSTTKKAAGK
jgi:hypothetical protein